MGRPYESLRLQAAVGPALRPGGLSLTRHAVDLCRFAGRAKVADLGCGPGATVDLLHRRGLAAIGLDNSRSMLDAARSLCPQAAWVQADAACLPLRTAGLDGVFCECVLSLAGDPVRVLGEIHRVLAPGGRLVLADLYLRRHAGGVSGGLSGGCLAGARGRGEVEWSLEAAGFRVLWWEDHSEALKHLAARLVFAGLRPAEVFGPADACGPTPPRGRPGSARPGYALWIARKEGGRG